ncbi:MAG: phosphatidylglycerol lysyltransferase domain-containing protein [Bacillota bacterium]|nr:phosphatidylglycerol lysyltransferase domain-containing protein [Bacillota bacterium]
MDEFSKLSGVIQLGQWSFNVIDISDKELYSDYIRKTRYPANLWSANFDFLWAVSQSRIRKVLWKIVDNMLVTFGYLLSGPLYLICLPYGEGDVEKVVKAAVDCLRYCADWNKDKDPGTVIKVVNEQQLEFLKQHPGFQDFFRVTGLVGKEKFFSIPKLLSLHGKDFDTIRRKINKFRKTCPGAAVREYREEDFKKVMKLGEYWSETSGKKYSNVFDNIYFREIIRHCRELNHIVLVVEYDGKIIGMVSGGDLPNGQSWWCLSKFMNDYDGLSEFLVIEIARAINRRNHRIELMNAAEDLGPGGLRFFKERFRPALDLKRYVLKFKE